MIRKLALRAAAAVSMLALAGPASAAVLTFTELGSPNVAVTNQYAAHGVGFTAFWLYTSDRDTVDGRGIGGIGGSGTPTINFAAPTGGVSLQFAALAHHNFSLAAYDASDVLLETFLSPAATSDAMPSYNFASNGISSLRLTASNFGYAGITTLAFDQVAAVPEPATWALMIIGFGAVGFSLRTQRRNQTLAAA